jgi:SRSO17 transposase
VILDDVAERVEMWAGELSGWMDRVAGVFSRPEPREVFEQVVTGLLSPLPRKNGWTLAEHAGHTHPSRVQTFLNRGAWKPSDLQRHIREMVVEGLGDPEGVLIVDDTQMIKKGVTSVGVAPQHCGATNQTENCQVVVMLAYASKRGHAFIGHRLYLPERWTSDAVRCRQAGMPKDVGFATKPVQAVQAVQLLAEADAARVPYGWIAADGGYGQYRQVRDWPTDHSRRYVMAVPSSLPLTCVHAIDGQQPVRRVDDLLPRAVRWERRSCGHGTKGMRFYDWAVFTVTLPDEPPADGFRPHPADPPQRHRPVRGGLLPGPRPARHHPHGDDQGGGDEVEDRGVQRAGKRPARPGLPPGADLDRVPPPRRGLHVRPRLRRHPPRPPATPRRTRPAR